MFSLLSFFLHFLSATTLVVVTVATAKVTGERVIVVDFVKVWSCVLSPEVMGGVALKTDPEGRGGVCFPGLCLLLPEGELAGSDKGAIVGHVEGASTSFLFSYVSDVFLPCFYFYVVLFVWSPPEGDPGECSTMGSADVPTVFADATIGNRGTVPARV